jgi:large subunit ribosomal protein L4
MAAAPKAPVLDAAGAKAKDMTLDATVFAAEIKPHLIHETVRAEAAASRAGTRATKSRAMVAGGAAKPWRQKGTGRARQGTTRAPQWTGGGVAFAHRPRSFELKVNRKVRKSSLRGALSHHAARGTLALVSSTTFGDTPSTRSAAAFVTAWGKELPLVVVALPEEQAFVKSFRNLPGVLVLEPAAIEVGAIVWARSLLVSEAAFPRMQERAV